MLNNRLGTQPLDPNILLKLEKGVPAASVAKTQPLSAPEGLLNPGLLGDAFRQPPSTQGSVPAQTGAVREALKPIEMKPLSAPISAPGLGVATQGPSLSDTEATLLLDLSAKLGDMRYQSPINFSQAVSALQKINLTGSQGFTQLTSSQRQILDNLGITPENSNNILQKLYQVILPDSQGGNTSSSFQQAKSSVNSFLSGLNLQEQAMSVIRNAEDLNQVAQLVDGLSAGGISSLLADRAIVVNDLAVGEINSQNFQITTPMDFTVGQVFVNAQNAPEKLDGVASILQKVKQSAPLNREETLLLGEYGLFVNKDKQLQTMNAESPLPEQSIAQLEQMLTTVKSSSNTEMYNQVIGQSIALLQSSEQYLALSEKARNMALELVKESDQVAGNTALLDQQRQQANILQAKLDTEQDKAQNLVNASAVVDAINVGSTQGGGPIAFGITNVTAPVIGSMSAGVSAFQKPDLSPGEIADVFEKIGIQVQEGAGGYQFFLNGRELSREEVKSYVTQSLSQVSKDLGNTANALKHQQNKVNATSEEVKAGQQRVRTRQEELDAVETELAAAEQQYTQDLKAYQDIRDKARLELPPDELAQLDQVLDPMISRVATEAFMHRAQTQVIINAAEAQATQVMAEADRALADLARDQEQWNTSLKAAEASLTDLQTFLNASATANTKTATKAEPEDAAPAAEARRERRGYNPLEQPAKSGTAPLNPVWLDRHSAEMTQKAQEKAQAQARNEQIYFENLQNEKRFDADMQKQREAVDAQRLEANRRRAAEDV